MNTNSNTYTVIYSIILVVVVAAVLAFAAMFLKPTQDANVKKDTISQILTAATFSGVEDAAILDTYKAEIESAILVETNITPDRTPKTCTVARDYCDAVLEDIYRESLLLCSDLLLEI